MKATGIVRRIDDLGRVVIPKEIRRTMRIREGDPLEIYTAADGEVIFKKYSPMGDFAEFTAQYAEVLNKATGMPVFITDRDRVVAYSGAGKRDFTDRRISKELEGLMEERLSFVASPRSGVTLTPADGREEKACLAFPVVSAGDVSGAVVALFNQKGDYPAQPDAKLLQVAAQFLAKQTEE
ncbi:MAG: AbrB/MazE/SpoVT family DNA-binding domain-containing protein [Clostridia bacterium]|nr:AbrB/MazE/SpoVT family DNA-binding domain-containing protein [Clostridia bacterium]